MLGGCGGLVAPPQERTAYVASPNHNERRPNFVILHDTSNDNAARALNTLTDPQREVSAHYLIGRDGMLYQLVDENRRAWHAGASYWGGSTDLNSASIGIELDNDGSEPYAEVQVVRLLGLLQEIQARHRIPSANFLGHGDVAPRRKVDPGPHFPWERLAQAGFGLWCRDPSLHSADLPDPMLALQAIGYETVEPAAALAAFRRHFLGSEDTAEAASEDERRWLACLLREKRNGNGAATAATPSAEVSRQKEGSAGGSAAEAGKNL